MRREAVPPPQVNIIRTVEVELQNKISDQQTSLEFETKARASNARRADEGRKKVAQMAGSEGLPPPLTEKEMVPLKLSDLEFRSALSLPSAKLAGLRFACVWLVILTDKLVR